MLFQTGKNLFLNRKEDISFLIRIWVIKQLMDPTDFYYMGKNKVNGAQNIFFHVQQKIECQSIKRRRAHLIQ